MAWKRRARGVACAPHMHRRHSGATRAARHRRRSDAPKRCKESSYRDEDDHDADELRGERDFVSAQPVGVARAVEFLMMPADDRLMANTRIT